VTVPSKALPLPWILGGVAIAAVAIVLVVLMMVWKPSSNGDKPIVKAPSGQGTGPVVRSSVPAVIVSIDAQPYANVEITGENLKEKITEQTPCLVSLQPGQYTVLFENSSFHSFSETIDVNSSNTSFKFSFKQLNPESIADSVVK
jgi:PEGA domain